MYDIGRMPVRSIDWRFHYKAACKWISYSILLIYESPIFVVSPIQTKWLCPGSILLLCFPAQKREIKQKQGEFSEMISCSRSWLWLAGKVLLWNFKTAIWESSGVYGTTYRIHNSLTPLPEKQCICQSFAMTIVWVQSQPKKVKGTTLICQCN